MLNNHSNTPKSITKNNKSQRIKEINEITQDKTKQIISREKEVTNTDKFLKLNNLKQLLTFLNKVKVPTNYIRIFLSIIKHPNLPTSLYLPLYEGFIKKYERYQEQKEWSKQVYYIKVELAFSQVVSKSWVDVLTRIKALKLLQTPSNIKVLVEWFILNYDDSKCLYVLRLVRSKIREPKDDIILEDIVTSLSIAIWKSWNKKNIKEALNLSKHTRPDKYLIKAFIENYIDEIVLDLLELVSNKWKNNKIFSWVLEDIICNAIIKKWSFETIDKAIDLVGNIRIRNNLLTFNKLFNDSIRI